METFTATELSPSSDPFARKVGPVPSLQLKRRGFNRTQDSFDSFVPSQLASRPRPKGIRLDAVNANALAADISENFHIGSNHSLPTPRRALFGPTATKSASFASTPTTFVSHDTYTPSTSSTPLATSTPYLELDATPKDATPKDSSFAGSRFDHLANTPTASGRLSLQVPLESTLKDTGMSLMSPVSRIAPHRLQFKRQSASTPSLTSNARSQGLQAPSLESLGWSRKLGTAKQPTLDEDLDPLTPLKLGEPANLSNDTFSPTGQTALRDTFARSNTMGFPPNKVRRTQSMFESPEDFVSQEVSPYGPSFSSSPNGEQGILGRFDCKLETFTVKKDPFRRIKRETLVDLLDGRYSDMFESVMVIDCRFEYEYEGGHIAGAININNKDKLENDLVHKISSIKRTPSSKVLLVFHCEYSAYRGPLMATHLRQCDRQANIACYPNLHYPDIVILDGGYSHFYELHNTRCQPQNYVEMNNEMHRSTCERELERFRGNMRLRKAPTFSSYSEYAQGSPGKPFRFPCRELDTNSNTTIRRM